MNVTQSVAIVSWVIIALLSIGFAALVRQVAILTRMTRAGFYSSSITGSNPIIGLRIPDQFKFLGWSSSNLVLLFTAPSCTSCGGLLRNLTHSSDRFSSLDCNFVVISKGYCPNDSSLPPDWPCIEESSEEYKLFQLFNVPGTPYVAVVNSDGVVLDADFVVDIDGLASLIAAIDQPPSNYLSTM